MGVEFTTAQKEAIDLRDCNILVSAAAGSGKTAVLSERIVEIICDETHPVDVDRLLVVTFTSAAAAEMRERIGNKLADRLKDNPTSEHLQRQMTLLHNAQITTIDSFCLFLVKNHFQEIGLDPAFRVSDEREIKLLQQEALAELFEEAFEEGRPEFHNCIEVFCANGREKALEDHVLNLSRYAVSFPWPEEWLLARKKDYENTDISDPATGALGEYFLHYLKGFLAGCAQKMSQAVALSHQPDGPYMYGETLETDQENFEKACEALDQLFVHDKEREEERDMALAEREQAQKLAEAGTESALAEHADQVANVDAAEQEELARLNELEERENDFDRVRRILEGITFGKLPGKKDDTVDKEKKERAQDLREEVKKALKALNDQYFGLPDIIRQRHDIGCRAPVCELIDLVLSFDRRMKEKKQEKKIIDFNDMEHFALDILLKRDPNGGEPQPTQVAKQYQEYFYEILIDEYQDSNLVQEYLLRAVSGEASGHYNRFMVGDVKQSIYRFRLARPELFLEKYHKYQNTGALRRIDLSKNFRSRAEVIDAVNNTFRRTMCTDIGGLEYDDAAALWLGAEYPANEGMQTELLLVEKPGKEEGYRAREAEAYVVATRIQRLLKESKVTDKETKELRPVRFRDIVILLRTLDGWGDTFKTVLEKEGIPAYVTSKKGYFTATEVQTVLNFLRVIDNPLQDIPMFGALHSPFGGFSEEEIALLRGADRELPLYECLKKSEDPKAVAFLAKLERYREKSGYLSIRTLLERILWEHDYLNYVTAMPGGSKRRANLEMLLVKASDFEKTSFFGLFHFLRYVEMLEKYQEDYGEADTLDENADVVRIMSIHKSKGLEFPVTIVSAMAKQFNQQETTNAVILDADLGLGMDYVDPARRLKAKTLRKRIISTKMKEDLLSEELRLLYVAMTRAKEKLILTAEVGNVDAVMQTSEFFGDENARLSYLEFMKSNSYLDFLEPILAQTGIEVYQVFLAELETANATGALMAEASREHLQRARELADPVALEALSDRFAYSYEHANLEGLYVKTTVSELKIAAMADTDEAAFHAFEETEEEAYVPAFRRGEREVSGTVRGNAYHRVMELLDFRSFEEDMPQETLWEKVSEFLAAEVADHRLSEEYHAAVNVNKICKFLRSELGHRMMRAQAAGTLRREQPFVLAIPARRLKESFPEDETVLIQGIIDAYFEEEDGIVLLDYKTDRIPSLDALWNRYEAQMDHYQEALERLTGKKVKERILYSFHFDAASTK
ncbi:MAG: helicase-exonuclease AddAB subunit AddA [Acetatifactor sp.]|nr:helicase-exonuclease AddAB subunit AddA [Acetatifactor sp.]